MVRGEELRAHGSNSLSNSRADICGYKLARWFQQQTSPACDEFLTRSKDRGCGGGLWVAPTNSYVWCRRLKCVMSEGEGLRCPAARGRLQVTACPGHSTFERCFVCHVVLCGEVGTNQSSDCPHGPRKAAQNCIQTEEGSMDISWHEVVLPNGCDWWVWLFSADCLVSLLISLLTIT